jgi:hypothetical protein
LHVWTAILLCVIGFIYQFYINTAYQISQKNVVRSYDAIDFKKFENFYSINPESNLSYLSIYVRTSVADGILNSYAKLDAIEVKR